MAGMTTIALQALAAAQTVGTIATAVSAGTNILGSKGEDSSRLILQQLQQKQNLENQRAFEKSELEKQKIKVNASEEETKRRLSLKRAVARQRAKFGGSGISSNSGSSEAVLLGLFEESEDERSTRKKLDNISLQSIDQNLNNTYRVNTLTRTQEQEKQRLKNSRSTFETVTDLFSIF